MQKAFLVSDRQSLEELNRKLADGDENYVRDISRPNPRGEWLVVVDDDAGDEDDED